MMIPKAEDIRPKKNGHSDFFSWQLYRYMRKYADPSNQRIYSGTWNNIDGVNRERPVLYIGCMDEDGWFHGRRLRNLCSSGSKINRYAYHHEHDTKNWKDVTDDFWSDYMKKGVCAIHGDFAHRWVQGVDIRACEYCGKEERRKVVMVEREVWE